jgi:hypothetical protein
MTFNITSDYGRIGEFWWINSDQRTHLFVSWCRMIRWGSCGMGRHPRITMESIDD